MKKRSLKFKLIAGGIAIVVLPMLIMGIYSVTKSTQALKDLAHNRALLVSQTLSEMTELFIEEELKTTAVLAHANTVIVACDAVAEAGIEGADVEIEVLEENLAATLAKHTESYEGIFVTDIKGNAFGDSSNGAYKGKNFSDRGYFKAAMAGKMGIDSPVISKATGNPVLPVAQAVKSKDGKVLGAVAMIVKMDYVSEATTGIKLGETGYPYIVDESGLFLAHPNPDIILKDSIAKLPGMEEFYRKAAASKSGVEAYTYKGVDKIAGFTTVESTGWIVVATQDEQEFLSAANSIRNIMLITGAACIGFALALVLLFVRSINAPITKFIRQLASGADQVAEASRQVSTSSQALAEGASEQAAGVEETSSSLEEMASMTRQSADNAQQTDVMGKESAKSINEATNAMNDLTQAISEVADASQETQKIIKTIDEIAFQTNLLALNAAVEAARAGEAGAGFAVVADEVRNLAMRAAEAAKNTAELIEGTVTKVNVGAQLVEKTNEAFSSVADHNSKVGTLVAEIAEASVQQSDGIKQINQAVAEMDKVIQQNAANAEESASASEELSAQAIDMHAIVEGLKSIVFGGQAPPSAPRQKGVSRRAPAAMAPRVEKAPQAALPARGEVKPNDVIPFDDDEDFQDF